MAATETAPSAVAEETGRLLFELGRRRHARLSAALAELDLTFVQAKALHLLEPDRPLAMSELAGALHCHASNVTGIVDRLETRGLVERRPGGADRRVKTLALTGAGAALRRRVAALLAEPPSEVAALPPADQRTLRDLLARALEARAAHRAGDYSE